MYVEIFPGRHVAGSFALLREIFRRLFFDMYFFHLNVDIWTPSDESNLDKKPRALFRIGGFWWPFWDPFKINLRFLTYNRTTGIVPEDESPVFIVWMYDWINWRTLFAFIVRKSHTSTNGMYSLYRYFDYIHICIETYLYTYRNICNQDDKRRCVLFWKKKQASSLPGFDSTQIDGGEKVKFPQ